MRPSSFKAEAGIRHTGDSSVVAGCRLQRWKLKLQVSRGARLKGSIGSLSSRLSVRIRFADR